MKAASIAALFVATSLFAPATLAADQDTQAADLRLYRLACGHIVVHKLNLFSDTQAYPGQTKALTDSCYLIKHGEDWLLWDTGLPDGLADAKAERGPISFTAETTLIAQLEQLGLRPEDIDYVGISHAHADHVGNVNLFPQATLIIQKAEWNAVFGDNAPLAAQADLLSAFKDGENVRLVTGDYDIFGDGTVVTLFTPGHTPGHQALLVRLPEAGPVILSGDAAHFTENWKTGQVPDFNTDRANTLASLDRLKRLADNLNARLIIQHEPSDIKALPEFPAYLE